MGKIRGELEDLAFRYLEPEASAELISEIESQRQPNEEFLKEIQHDVELKLRARRTFRPAWKAALKRAYSVYQKMKRQKIALDQVYDLLALRIITDSVKNCYAALGVIHNEWHPDSGTHQGFHRHSAPEPLSVAAHVGDRARTGSTSKCRSAPRRCTASPKKASPRTGSTKKAGRARRRTTSASPGCGNWSNGSGKCTIRASSCPR